MPNVTSESSLTLENCVNKGKIEAGYVGFAAGNQSRINELKSITIINCRNEDGGYVKGYMDAGDVSWNEKANGGYKNAAIENSSDLTIRSVSDGFTGTYTTDGEIVFKELPEETVTVMITGTYYLEGYYADKETSSLVHMTTYIPLTGKVESSNSLTCEKPLLAGDATAIEGDYKTGDVLDGKLYIGNEFHGGSGTEYACLKNKNNAEHSAYPSAVYATCYDAEDNKITVIKLVKV